MLAATDNEVSSFIYHVAISILFIGIVQEKLTSKQNVGKSITCQWVTVGQIKSNSVLCLLSYLGTIFHSFTDKWNTNTRGLGKVLCGVLTAIHICLFEARSVRDLRCSVIALVYCK